jgi:spore germination protein
MQYNNLKFKDEVMGDGRWEMGRLFASISIYTLFNSLIIAFKNLRQQYRKTVYRLPFIVKSFIVKSFIVKSFIVKSFIVYRKIVLLFTLYFLLSPTVSVAQSGRYQVLGYHNSWMNDAWKFTPWQTYTGIVFHHLELEGDGNFKSSNGWPLSWAELILETQIRRKPIIPSIALLEDAKFVQLFTNDLAQRRLLQNTIQTVQAANADALHLDFEVFSNVPYEAKVNFTRYVANVRAALNRMSPRKKLYIFSLAIDPADAFDETRLAQYADYLVVQGFDLHWKNSDVAGPTAPTSGWGRRNWTYVLERYRALRVPMNKIIMGIPLYGYEWATETNQLASKTRGDGESIMYSLYAGRDRYSGSNISAKDRANQYGLRRDPVSQAPYYTYQEAGGGWKQGWFEDATSLRTKFNFVKRNGLAGVAMFCIHFDNGELTWVLGEAFR